MSERLELLRPVLSQFTRRFSVFSLGSGVEDGLEREIANQFNAVVVCAEKDPIRYTPSCKMIVLQREFSAQDLETFALSEHFDVVLAMNILHWCGKDWLRVQRALVNLGASIIIQSPYSGDREACGQSVIPEIENLFDPQKSMGASVQFPGHMPRPIWASYLMRVKLLIAKFYGAPLDEVRGCVRTSYDSKTIQLLHKNNETAPFIPGMSLQDWRTLGGIHPKPSDIIRSLRALVPGDHRDIQPWNVRIDGTECYLIDRGGRDWPDSDTQNMQSLIEWVGGGANAAG